MNKICSHCKNEFEKPVNCSRKEWLTRRFCSKQCGYNSRDIGKTPKQCPTCKNMFVGIYSAKKYCSIIRFDVDNGQTLCRSCHKKVHEEIGKKTRFSRNAGTYQLQVS